MKNAKCSTCTIKLVNIAYKRAPWFRLLREPLKLGMRGLAWLYHVDPAEYAVQTPSCYGCLRFYKVALKDKSPFFRVLNNLVNPLFDAVLERIVTPEELEHTKDYARRATNGAVSNAEASQWLNE
jgi:hypothetical protein